MPLARKPEPPPPPPAYTKRLTVPVTDELHYRIKRASLDRRENMSDVVRAVLERTNWEKTE
jgi:hypothetical protein